MPCLEGSVFSTFNIARANLSTTSHAFLQTAPAEPQRHTYVCLLHSTASTYSIRPSLPAATFVLAAKQASRAQRKNTEPFSARYTDTVHPGPQLIDQSHTLPHATSSAKLFAANNATLEALAMCTSFTLPLVSLSLSQCHGVNGRWSLAI